jgi:hypothetical protein
MIAARIHPGLAVLAVVGAFTAALLILQSVSHRRTATVSATAPPATQSPPAAARKFSLLRNASLNTSPTFLGLLV